MAKRQISSEQVSEALNLLLAAGFVSTGKGRPAKEAKPIAPALAKALGITERRARQLIARRRTPTGLSQVPAGKAAAVAKAARLQMQQALGTKVDLRDHAGVGTVVVHYSGYRQLEDLMRRMGAL